MDNYPDPPPEGELIDTARKRIRPKLSAREAARRAGISEGWWRQVVRGYQPIRGGDKAPMTGSAETVASMARVVGVTPEQLDEAGRADAAEELRELQKPVAHVRDVRLTVPAPPAAEDEDPKMARAAELLAEATALLDEMRRERREGA